MSLSKLQQAIENAIQALEKLEEAMDSGDNRRIGAVLYELRHALKEAEHETR